MRPLFAFPAGVPSLPRVGEAMRQVHRLGRGCESRLVVVSTSILIRGGI